MDSDLGLHGRLRRVFFLAPPPSYVSDVTIVLILVGNALAFAVYGFDKHQARRGGDRIPEQTLLVLALIGGVGAYAACELFRHKTRKQPFRSWMMGAFAAHILIVLGLIYLR